MLKRTSRKKGFTIIELIAVIATIGVLVLLATPKVLGSVEKAKIAHIINDVKASENVIEAKLATGTKLKSYPLIEIEPNAFIYDTKGLRTEGVGGKLYDITGTINSKLDGLFVADSENKVYYVTKANFKTYDWHYYTEDEMYKGKARPIGAGSLSPDNVLFYPGHMGKDNVEGKTGISLVVNKNEIPDKITGMAGVFSPESYGIYEAKIKVPEQHGLLNGFFLAGTSGGINTPEIDIEMMYHEGEWQIWSTIHHRGHPDYVYGKYLPDYDPDIEYSEEGDNYAEPGIIYQNKVNFSDLGIDPTEDFVNYRIEYQENYVLFFVDDQEVGRWNNKFGNHDMEIVTSTFWASWLTKEKEAQLDKITDEEVKNGWYEEMNVEWIRKKLKSVN